MSEKNKPTLGVVSISYNEEQDLPGFLKNLESWVDEIVIIDDGSTDKTEEIAAQSTGNVKFIQSPREEGEYFSHQRNKGIDAAESDWLLHMDIDERVPEDLAKEILLAIKNESFDAYRYRRLNYFLHRPMSGGGWDSWNLVHLARREVFRFGGMFHEECLLTVEDNRIGQLRQKMWHLNEDCYAKRMRKSAMYAEEVIEEIKKSGLIARWWHLLAFPLKEFIKKFLFKKGFKDGVPGLLFAIHSSAAQFKAVACVWDEQNKKARSDIELMPELHYRVDDLSSEVE